MTASIAARAAKRRTPPEAMTDTPVTFGAQPIWHLYR